MIKVVKPKPFFLEGGNKAVLLLHSFTSNTRDVRELGKFLHKHGCSCYAPVYEGHGLAPEQLIATNPKDWLKDVDRGYQFLSNKGYAQIAVVGISLGGILALNVGQTLKVNGIITMSIPYKREISSLKGRLIKYARAFKQFQGKDKKEISNEVNELENSSIPFLTNFKNHIETTMKDLARINQPIKIMYGELDELLYKESAIYIHDRVSTNDKEIKGYANSKHLLTLGSDQDLIHNDVLSFLKELQW